MHILSASSDLAGGEDFEENDFLEVQEKFKALSVQPSTCGEGEVVGRRNGTQTIAVLDKEVGQSGMEAAADAYQGPSYVAAYIRTVEKEEEGDGETTATSLVTKAAKLLEKYQLENPDSLSMSDVLSSGGRNQRGTGGSKRTEGTKPAGGSEKYEKTMARHGDKMFLKFQKELSKCSQQVIRQECT